MTDHQYEAADRVRIDIPDETDPDYDRFHGRHGEIVAILVDDAGATQAMIATPCSIVSNWTMGR